MKRLMMMTALLMAVTVKAQGPMILGDNHAMLRVKQGTKYLLLPVQEKEENANIAVLDIRNEMVQRLNVRLAVDKVDYFVPFEIRNGQLLDITFHADKRTTGAMKDFVCWKEMKYSDTFDTTNRERFRPRYHHTPLYGWMNDPNGMFYKDGVWHLYYQYNPYGSQWENMSWGHSTSRDLIHWDAQPLAIESDWLGAIFSGSAIVDKDHTTGFGRNAVVAMYTSAGAAQTQSIAYSTDGGQTFTKYAGNPVITFNAPDFRDPKVFWHEPTSKWMVVLAVGQEVQFYSSKNLKEWKYESSFGREYGNHDGVWECPDMLCFGEKWVLLLNINPGGPFGGSATQYFVGRFDGHTFTCEDNPSETKWMDYGKDHYATVTFHNAPEGRIVALPWMSNWQYANQVPTQQFRSANGLPRDLGIKTIGGETILTCIPSKEVMALRGKKVKQPTEACEIVIDMKSSTDIVLSNAKGEQVTMHYDAQKQEFKMDRTKSGDVSFSEAFPCETAAPTFGSIKQLRLFIDRCSIEAFDAEGKMVMTNLVFPSEPYNTIKVKGGKTTIYQLDK
ncbi:levanase [Prevotella aff. ruminicola Tc2-24]|uniref:Levanase n=1 Tax=Prevotella aff. ruminicola Tc2-24 TaxID=81582 RepID=A0A1I0QD61_9BACT|nr:levanase [Prevotella aff. ruminicola Tc2-24]